MKHLGPSWFTCSLVGKKIIKGSRRIRIQLIGLGYFDSFICCAVCACTYKSQWWSHYAHHSLDFCCAIGPFRRVSLGTNWYGLFLVVKQRVFHTHGRMYRRALDIVELFLPAQLVGVALLESPPTNFHRQGPKPGQRDFYPNTWDHVAESLFRRLQ